MNKFLVGSSLVAAAGAVTAIAAAVQHSYGTCSIALFVVAAGAIGAYRISQSQDAANDHAVLHRLREAPQTAIDDLSHELGLRSAAVRLSIHRLTRSGELPPDADSTE
ncbi:hypothetical protein YWIDRAFT_07477 [Streptomyces sp. SceaMP-e96]|uniref:hypothetical protein n=1 Tax=unclassified Streptomyces TaxID=2593676 RepID=UPI000823BE26|nr:MULTISPECIES: hypothetical protein [unclassified Streptomyces]MYT17840.1 hypothetical protein [Streptomyces sp. SID4951]SCK47204.1 hypothetical protein YWIDRAFT_07477 [Streptomyces sp. SceaMP-e96]